MRTILRQLRVATGVATLVASSVPMWVLSGTSAYAEDSAAADEHADEHEHHHGKDGHADDHEHHHAEGGGDDDDHHHHEGD